MKTKLLTICLLLFTSQVFSGDFPFGTYKTKNFTIESGTRIIKSEDLYFYEGELTTKKISSNKISIKIYGKIAMTKNSGAKSDTRYDEMILKWSGKNNGTLINTNPKYSKDICYFTIEDKFLIFNSWVDRHQAWEKVFYILN